MAFPLKISTKISGLRHKNGMASFIVALIVLGIGLIIVLSIAFLVTTQQKITTNICNSSQAYFTPEAGVEDAILRVRKNMTIPSGNYNVPIGNEQAIVTINNPIGGSRTITSQGTKNNLWRKVQAVNTLSGDNVQFFFGAQVGEGGLEMEPNARIKGNVYANGSIINNSGTAYIDNNVIIAKNGNRLEGIAVGENATVYSCINSTIGKNLTYVNGGDLNGCAVNGSTTPQNDEIPTENLPISLNQVATWRQAAEKGSVWPNDMVIDSDIALGPLQIGTPLSPKNLDITNKKTLRINGTIFVTGNINICNQCKVELSQAAYGAASGVLLADGKISVDNNAILQGSGLSSSYLLLLSTNNSVNPDSPAIYIANNATGAVFYTTQGMISLRNNMKVREVTGYKIHIKNGATIEYESGLANLFFTSGPGAGWELVSWQEIP